MSAITCRAYILACEQLDVNQTGLLPCPTFKLLLETVLLGKQISLSLFSGQCSELWITADGSVLYKDFLLWCFEERPWQVPGLDDSTLGAPMRGINIEHLSQIAASLQENGLTAEATVKDIVTTLVMPKGQTLLCPRDNLPGTAYVDAVGPCEAGIANIMLSYSWGYKVCDVTSSLMDYCLASNFDLRSTHVWICCFCVNQHKVQASLKIGDAVSFQDFRSEFEARVTGINHVCALMSPWNNPNYLKRVWCVFEMFTAVMQKETVKLSIIMPEREKQSLKSALGHDCGIDSLWQALGNVRIEDAEASIAEDKEEILALIGSRVQEVNSAVVVACRTWIIDTLNVMLQSELHANIPENPSSTLKACENLNKILRLMEQYDEAEVIMQSALEFCASNKLLGTLHEADILQQISLLKRGRGSYHESFQLLEKVEAIRISLNDTLSPRAALMFLSKALIWSKLNNLVEAEASLSQAEHSARSSKVFDGNIGAMILRERGLIELRRQRPEGALKSLNAAMNIISSIGSDTTPMASKTLLSIAKIHFEMGNHLAAVDHYQKALAIRKRAGTMKTSAGLELLKLLGRAQVACGQLLEAKSTLDAGILLLEQMNLPQSDETSSMVSELIAFRSAVEANLVDGSAVTDLFSKASMQGTLIDDY